MSLFGLPYDTDVGDVDLNAPAMIGFDAAILQAVASPSALRRRGLHLDLTDATRPAAETTALRLCEHFTDYESACGLAFEDALTEARGDTAERSDVNVLLGPAYASLIDGGDAESAMRAAVTAYGRGLWEECEQRTAAALEVWPDDPAAWLLRGLCRLRAGDELGAREAAAAALADGTPRTDGTRLLASYLLAFLATRARDESTVLTLGPSLGALGGHDSVPDWPRALEPVARELAYLVVRACGVRALAGVVLPLPTIEERVVALLQRNPSAAIRLAAEPVMASARDEVLSGIRQVHGEIRRELDDMLKRWARNTMDDSDDAAGDEARRHQALEARAARDSAVHGLLDAIDARARVRSLAPDATRGPFAQRAYVADFDAPPLAVARTPIEPGQEHPLAGVAAEDSAVTRMRRDIERLRAAAERDVAAGNVDAFDEPTPMGPVTSARAHSQNVAAATAPFIFAALGCMLVAGALLFVPAVHDKIGTPSDLAGTGLGALSMLLLGIAGWRASLTS